MSSRRYKSYKFLYDDDRGNKSIKRQRSYLNSDGVTEDTPLTELFLDRVVDLDEVVTGTSQGLRHILAAVGNRRLKANIPYKPEDPKLISHSREILAAEGVICGDYIGERSLTGGSTAFIQ